MKNGKWSDEEVKALFKFVEVKRSEGIALINIFGSFADLTKRQKNSVRNYYYKEVLDLSANPKRAKKLKIDINQHRSKSVMAFTDVETKKLIEKIDEYKNNGYSVRRACLTLAGGDASMMIRFQNKYRLETMYKRKEDSMGRIIKMPNRQTAITDEEINALMLGIIKLVKKQEFEKAKKNIDEQLESANNKLRQAMVRIVEQGNEISRLKNQIRLLEDSVDNNKIKEIDERLAKASKHLQKTAKNTIGEFLEGEHNKNGGFAKSGV